MSEFCTQTSCPEMSGPGPRTYQWVDDRGKKSKLSAPQYIDYIMTYVQKTINDETVFPTKHGQDFPAAFLDIHIKKVHRLLFHVLAHVYHAHFKEIVLLQLHAHLNAVFAHFVAFNLKFSTVDEKEMEVLDDLVVALKLVPPRDGEAVPAAAKPIPQRSSSSAPASPTREAAPDDNKENIANDKSPAPAAAATAEDVICSQPMPSVDNLGIAGGGGGTAAAAASSSSEAMEDSPSAAAQPPE